MATQVSFAINKIWCSSINIFGAIRCIYCNFGKVLIKSVMGYGLAAIIAYTIWIVLSRYINEKFDKVENIKQWRSFSG